MVTEGGASYVDGGIIGLPPEIAGHTRLYLSGAAGRTRSGPCSAGRRLTRGSPTGRRSRRRR